MGRAWSLIWLWRYVRNHCIPEHCSVFSFTNCMNCSGLAHRAWFSPCWTRVGFHHGHSRLKQRFSCFPKSVLHRPLLLHTFSYVYCHYTSTTDQKGLMMTTACGKTSRKISWNLKKISQSSSKIHRKSAKFPLYQRTIVQITRVLRGILYLGPLQEA